MGIYSHFKKRWKTFSAESQLWQEILISILIKITIIVVRCHNHIQIFVVDQVDIAG